MESEEARTYLSSLLNKNLRITSTDRRIFHGQFKCTDPDQNVILANTCEYREPSLQQRQQAFAEAAAAGQQGGGGGGGAPPAATVKLDMSLRHMGLVVVPGQHILKIEVEEFASQMKPPPPAASGRGRLVEEADAALKVRRGNAS